MTTNYPRTFMRDMVGEIVPLGQTERVLYEPFMTGTLPPWLATTGTATLNPLSSSRGGVTVATGAVAGNAASLATSFPVRLDQHAAVLWEIEGLSFDASQVVADVSLSLNNSGAVGAYVQQKSTETQAFIRQGAANFAVPYDIRSAAGQATSRHNLGILYSVRGKEAVFLRDRRVIGWADLTTGFNPATVTPTVSIVTQQATAHSLTALGARLTLWTN